MVKKNIDSSVYKTELEMVNDCMRVFNNAKTFYNEGSQIYSDALKLQAYLTNRYQLLSNQRNKTPLELTEIKPPTVTASTVPTPTNTPQQETSLPKFVDVKDKLIYLYNYINNFQIDGRDLAYPFRHLPSRTEYPDYYSIIKKPIDMAKIWHKLNQYGHTSSYVTLDDMCADFGQMFENACTYNEPGSTIFKDALNLQRALFTKRNQIIASELSSYAGGDDLSGHETLPVDFVANQVQELIENLFDSCMHYQDTEGRSLVDTFLDLYYLYEQEQPDTPMVTFEVIRQRIKDRVYKVGILYID
jgi:protein polybromo-1